MKLVLGADLHGSAKTRRKLATFKQLLRDFTQLAITYGTYKVLIAGDLFDKRFGLDPEVVIALAEELDYAESRGVTWLILPGNHDIFSKSNMAATLLRVFNKVAYVWADGPQVISLPQGGGLMLAPWRPIPKLKQDLASLAMAAAKLKDGPKVLITHTPLKEGFASASNYRVSDLDICVGDMFPDAYDLILLGDYHQEQQVGANAYYLGAPIQHNHGDINPGGAKLLDLTGKTPVIKKLKLPTDHPKYVTWDLTHIKREEDLVISNYNPDDYNRIRIDSSLADAAVAAYPTAQIQRVVTSGRLKTLGRMEGADPKNPGDVMLKYAKLKGWDDQRFGVGMEIVMEAMQL